MNKSTTTHLIAVIVLAWVALHGLSRPGLSGADPDTVINELRIDQPNADDDEYFELAGPAGESLDDMTYLVIGDGSGGNGVIEAVVNLGGTAVGPTGFFVAAESSFSLGTADLVTSLSFENSDNVTHALVRDFSGTNGMDLDLDEDGQFDLMPWSEIVDCIALLESEGSGDLVYCETTMGPDAATVPGHVYRCPEMWALGSFATDVDDTPGVANICSSPAGLVINEVDYAQSIHIGSEFIEIRNNSADEIALGDVAVELVDGLTLSHYASFALPDLSLAAGDYFVVCSDARQTPNCDLDVSPDSDLIQDGAPDAVLLTQAGTIIDAVTYDGDLPAPYGEGSGIGLVDDGAAVFAGIARYPDGSDSDQNNVDLSPRCVTPGAANTGASDGCTSPSHITNDAGCYIVALAGSPYDGPANVAHSAQLALVFDAVSWAEAEALPADACFEIHGTDAGDKIHSGPGADLIVGYGGSDGLFGGPGDDLFVGGAGYDRFMGQAGADTVSDFDPVFDRCSSIEAGCLQ